jgi:hypothetical protein
MEARRRGAGWVRTIQEGLRAGGALAAVWIATWIVVLASIPPKPSEFPRMKESPCPRTILDGGISFDLRACIDLPAFSIFGRGLPNPQKRLVTQLPVVWSWPALQLASRQSQVFDVREVEPFAFLALLAAQWTVLGVAVRVACKATGSISRWGRGHRTSGWS